MKEKYEEWMRQCGWSCNGWIPSRKRKNKKMSLCVTFLKAWGYKREWFMTPHSRFSWCMSTQKWKKTSRKYRILVHKIRIIASWHRIIISVCFLFYHIEISWRYDWVSPHLERVHLVKQKFLELLVAVKKLKGFWIHLPYIQKWHTASVNFLALVF